MIKMIMLMISFVFLAGCINSENKEIKQSMVIRSNFIMTQIEKIFPHNFQEFDFSVSDEQINLHNNKKLHDISQMITKHPENIKYLFLLEFSPDKENCTKTTGLIERKGDLFLMNFECQNNKTILSEELLLHNKSVIVLDHIGKLNYLQTDKPNLQKICAVIIRAENEILIFSAMHGLPYKIYGLQRDEGKFWNLHKIKPWDPVRH